MHDGAAGRMHVWLIEGQLAATNELRIQSVANSKQNPDISASP